MKLHLECGGHYLKGWVNVGDSRGISPDKTAKLDLDMNVLELNIASGSLERLRVNHVLEHFHRWQTAALIGVWNRWMAIGGAIELVVPDFGETVRSFGESSLAQQYAKLRHLFGNKKSPGVGNFEGWSAEGVSDLLHQFGFEAVICRSEAVGDGVFDMTATGKKAKELASPFDAMERYLKQFELSPAELAVTMREAETLYSSILKRPQLTAANKHLPTLDVSAEENLDVSKSMNADNIPFLINPETEQAGRSRFEKELRALVAHVRPHKIIETGTYLGQGASTVVANALHEYGIDNFIFYGIEANPDHYRRAAQYFRRNGLRIRLLNGHSLQRDGLPSVEDIAREYAHETGPDSEGSAAIALAQSYQKETVFGVPDDLLEQAMSRFDFRPDLVILAHAAPIAAREVMRFLELIEGECYLVLDNSRYAGTRQRADVLRQDSRFKVIISDQTNDSGFSIAHFKPQGHNSVPLHRTLPMHNLAKGELVEPAAALEKEGARLLVIKPETISEYVLFTALAKAMRKHYPTAKMTLLCSDEAVPLAQRSPVWQEILGVDRKKLAETEYMDSVLECVKQQSWDMIFYPSFSREWWVDCWVREIDAGIKVGMSGDARRETEAERLAGNAVYTHLWNGQVEAVSELSRLELLARALGIESKAKVEPSLDFLPEDLTLAATLARKYRDAIVLAPFEQAEHLRWSLTNYAELIRRLRLNSKLPIVITGSATDTVQAMRLIRTASVENVFSLCGQMTLPVQAAFLKRSKLLIGGESAPIHFASAVNIPQVVIMGGGNYERHLPWSKLSTIVSRPLPCFGCDWKCTRASYQCITGVSVDDVWRAAAKHLKPEVKGERISESEVRRIAAAASIPTSLQPRR